MKKIKEILFSIRIGMQAMRVFRVIVGFSFAILSAIGICFLVLYAEYNNLSNWWAVPICMLIYPVAVAMDKILPASARISE